MQPDLSIVVLVYKTARLLGRCLDSLVCSEGYDSRHVEIVVVNDGSPDECDDVVQMYLVKHPEIVYVRRERNGGEAAARNSGLVNCTGRYYTYVDSDDTVTGDYLSRIRTALTSSAPDVLTYQYRICDSDGRHQSGGKGDFEGVCCVEDGAEARRRIFARFAMALRCNAVIRREMMDGVRYAEEYALGVDALFAFEAFCRARKFAWVSDVLYNYFQYSSSATHNFDERRILDLMKIHRVYLDRIDRLPYKSEVADLVYGFFTMNYLGWLLDEVMRFGANSPAAESLRMVYRRVVDDAFRHRVIGRFRFRLLTFVLGRPLEAWGVLKRIYRSEDLLRRVRNRVWRICHVG